MRWHSKIKPVYRVGDTREKTRFLFWPKRLVNAVAVDWESSTIWEWRWLETASWSQRYVGAPHSQDMWKDGYWTSE